MLQAQAHQAQGAGDFLHLRVDHVEIMGVQQLLDLRQLIHPGGHFILGGLAQLVADFVHARFQLKQPGKRAAQHILDGHAGGQHRMLIQIAHAHPGRPLHLAVVRLKLAGHDGHEGGLAFTIGAHQTNMFALEQAERNILENGAIAKTVGEMLNSKNAHAGTPLQCRSF